MKEGRDRHRDAIRKVIKLPGARLESVDLACKIGRKTEFSTAQSSSLSEMKSSGGIK